MSAPAPGTAHWPTQTEAAVILATNERTIRRWIDAGRLNAASRPVAGRKPLVIVDPADVERLRVERLPPVLIRDVQREEHPTTVAVRDADMAPNARIPGFPAAPDLCRDLGISKREARELQRAALYRSMLQEARPWLTLSAASASTGLPVGLLSLLIREKRLPSIRFGRSTYVKRHDVEQLDAG